VRKLGLECVVGKRIDSIYELGERSGAWLKLRVNLEQEFVIGGYTPGAHGFDALPEGAWAALTKIGLSPGASTSHVRFEPDLKEAVADADLVQENAPEREPVKIKLSRISI
jgi:hypothetical protein